MILLKHIFAFLAIACFGYSILMIAYAGPKTAFLPFWLLMGVGTTGIWAILRDLISKQHGISRIVTVSLWVIFLIVCIVFSTVEYKIISAGRQVPQENAPYVIVLGAQVKGTKITKSLRYRLDSAIEYLRNNEETKVIVSGGKGTGEFVTEASAMREYLCSFGIESRRIMCEDSSTNTYENIKFSQEFVNNFTDRIIIVTNRFHLYRAIQIAKKQGLKVEGLGAKSDPILTVSYYVREFFAVVKDQLLKNM